MEVMLCSLIRELNNNKFVKRNIPDVVVILTIESFPIGLAGTNRILTYCKGFLYHGYQPEVLCVKPTDHYNNVFNTSVKGIFNDIKYSYPGGKTIRDASFWRRRINDFTAFLFSLKTLLSIFKKNKVAFIIFYGNYDITELSCILISKLFRTKIYKEESENPLVYFNDNRSSLKKIIEWFYINKLYKFYSGVLVMTHPLKDFFLTKGIPERKILVVPQTVDIERFDNVIYNSAISLPNDYVAYVGSLNEQKDGVLTLLESFTEVSTKYPEIHLIIAGEGTQKEKNELLARIIQLHLNERVHYIGRISSNKIPAFFHGAKMLASCRPISIQSDYGFPTKVVEYLASGKPIVTTTPGELAFYLKDRITAFVAKKAEHNTFTSKMLEVLDDYEFALKVAQKGKELAKEQFSPITQTKKIIDFNIEQRNERNT